jgi:Uncharacterized protein conserved in bacteria
LHVKIHRSISEIDEGRWDAIVGKEQIFCTHKYIESLEKSGMNENRHYYAVVYDGDQIVAHAPVYYLSTELDVFAQGVIRKMIHSVRRKWKDFFILRSLEIGPPVALGSTMSFKDDIVHAPVLRLLCHGIDELAKELGIKFIIYRDFYDDKAKVCALLEERGYEKIHNLPKAELTIRWKSFDDYLNAMRSGYRSQIVKSMEKCAKAGILIEAMRDPSLHSHELKRLYDNVSHQAKELKREHLSEIYFRDIYKYLGEKAVILAARKEGRIIGFMLLLFNGKEMISSLIGLDYDYNRKYCIYFNLFYETIRIAIDKGMDKVDMGITTLDPKRDMGSDILPLTMYMKHSNPVFNKIIPTLFDLITPPDTTAARNVFK